MNPTLKAAVVALSLFGVAPMIAGCGEAEDAVEDVRSWEACDDYCDRKSDCADESLSSEEDEECTNECIDTLDDTCDADHRSEAIDTLNNCVEEACGEFYGCLVFDAAPACFGFVD